MPALREKHPITINLKEFMQSTEPLSNSLARGAKNEERNRDASLSKLTDIYYFVFDQAGTYMASFKHQNAATDTSFGEIRDTLYSDSYVVYLFASDTALNVATAANVANSIIFTTLTASNELVPFKDVFYKKIVQ